MTTRNLILICAQFFGLLCIAQPVNDECADALPLCPGVTLASSVTGATQNPTDYNHCFTPENSIWFTFTTNAVGGGVTISLTDIFINPDATYGQELRAFFFSTAGACGVTPFTPMSNCGVSIASAPFDLNELIVLDPNTTYYVLVSGTSDGATNPTEADFNISISGTAVETPDPSVTISIDDPIVCEGYETPINVDIIDCSDTSTYNWYYNGDLIYTSSENDFTTNGLTADGALALELTCGTSCPKLATSNTLNLSIINVSAEAGDDKIIQEGEQVILEGSGVGNPTWTPITGLSSDMTFTPVSSPEFTTNYFLQTENNGCFATDSMTVFVGDVITIYTTFSPNGDGVNDRWHILNSEKFPNMEVTIYDRSGQLVFNAINYTQEDQWWDGTFKNKDLPASAYYYLVALNDENNTLYKGYINLIR